MPPKKKMETKNKAEGNSPAKAPKAAAKPKAPRKAAKTPDKKTSPVGPKSGKTRVVSAAKEPASSPSLPSPAEKKAAKHGETQMVAFIRDPHCIFTYWEVTPQSIEAVDRKST